MPQKNEYLTALATMIKLQHKCNSTHRETVTVPGEGVAGLPVEVFDLRDHSHADVCYAWSQTESSHVKVWTVLGDDKITSPDRAVASALHRNLHSPRFPRGRW